MGKLDFACRNCNNQCDIEIVQTESNKSITDNTLKGFNEIETHTFDENLNASPNIDRKSLTEKSRKEWFKTYFTFQNFTSKDLTDENKQNEKEIIVQYSAFLNPNHSEQNNSVEVLVDAIDMNELSIILPRFSNKNFVKKTNKQTINSTEKQTEKIKEQNVIIRNTIKELTKREKTITTSSSTQKVNKSPIKTTNLITNFNLFHYNQQNNKEKLKNDKTNVKTCQNSCHLNKCYNSGCQYHKSFQTPIDSGNLSNKTFRMNNQNKYLNNINNGKSNFEKHLENLAPMSQEEWYKLNKKYNGSSGIHHQLCRIRQKYVNFNNNNNRNNTKRITKSATDINNSFKNHSFTNYRFCSNGSQINRDKCCNKRETQMQNRMPCYSERRFINNEPNRCMKMCCSNQLNPIENYQQNEQYHEHCHNMCGNPNPTNQFHNPCERDQIYSDNQNLYEYYGENSDNCCRCQPVSSNCCSESHRSFRNKQTNNVTNNPDDSVKTVYCESPTSQRDGESEECYCPCACRCSQFPKPAPYCLNTTYRMNYFQKCIPTFRRYRECDNLFLPLC